MLCHENKFVHNTCQMLGKSDYFSRYNILKNIYLQEYKGLFQNCFGRAVLDIKDNML